MLLARESTELAGLWWALPVGLVVLVGLATWLLLPAPAVAGGSNRAARGALALLVLSCGTWLLAPSASRPGTLGGAAEGLLWLAALLGFLIGIVLALIGARRVRERGDRALAAAAVALSASPPVFIAAALVVCFIETPGCFS